MKRSSSKATIKTIAAECGVSAQTVSRVANGLEALHKPETVEKVRAAMARAGFLPDSSARRMRSGRKGAIALLQQAGGQGSYLPSALLEGVSRRAEELDLQLVFARAALAPDGSFAALPKILRERQVDGMVVNINLQASPRLEKALSASGLPAVWVNADRKADCVRPDDFQAGRLAALHLAGRGVSSPLYFHSSLGSHYSVAARRDGVLAGFEESGVACLAVEPAEFGEEIDAEALASFLSARGVRPDAVVGYSLESIAVAFNAVSLLFGFAAATKLERLAFGLSEFNLEALPAETMKLPFEEAGRLAVDMLVAKLERPSSRHPLVKVPFCESFKIYERPRKGAFPCDSISTSKKQAL